MIYKNSKYYTQCSACGFKKQHIWDSDEEPFNKLSRLYSNGICSLLQKCPNCESFSFFKFLYLKLVKDERGIATNEFNTGDIEEPLLERFKNAI